MKHKLFFLLLFSILTASLFAQTQPKPLRIVDTLTKLEKKNRNPILLRSELDSMIKAYEASLPKTEPKIEEPVIKKEELKPAPQENSLSAWTIGAFIFLILLAGVLVWLFYQQQKKFGRLSGELQKNIKLLEFYAKYPTNGEANLYDKKLISDMQTKTKDLTTKIEKLKTENESLNAVVKEYKRTQGELETLIKTIGKTFKVKKYPGTSEGKTEVESLLGLFETEKDFTNHAYENYLKPVIAIADANKNNPTGISKEQQDKMLELLISLSLLYIEYLYLRVNDLSVGGNMVQRISDIKKGLKPDPSLLKKLNTQNGSRALVLYLALEKRDLQPLSYPVFEETNLNNHQ